MKVTKETLKEFVAEGLAETEDEAAHMLVDMGEITSDQHEELLSPKERKRIYG